MSSLMLNSTSKSASRLSASVLAERISLHADTNWGKSKTCRDAKEYRFICEIDWNNLGGHKRYKCLVPKLFFCVKY